MTKFIHLNCHSEYSITAGMLQINQFVAKAASMQMPAIALTEHSNLFSMVKFYRRAREQGVKPIIGCELLLQNSSDLHKPFSLVALCQNQLGLQNLLQLISNSYLHKQDGHKPVVTSRQLVKYQQGLIVIAKGVYSDIGQALLANNLELAVTLAEHWSGIFSNRFYLAVTRTNRNYEERYIELAVDLASNKGIPLVATNDVYFLEENDFTAHEARVCINEGTKLNDAARNKLYSNQQFLCNESKMEQLFADLPEALINSVEIAKRCNLELSLGGTHLPRFKNHTKSSEEEYLTEIATKGLQKKLQAYQNLSIKEQDKYTNRLHTELQVINSMGFAGYFLIVADFIKWALKQGIPVGPGRGSGAGSLVAYALQITNIDPIPYDLLFERFLNPERVSMPDFDIDFCMEGRDKVIAYVSKTYGSDAVAQIITYGTMAAKAVIRDIGRVLGHPYGFVDQIAKMIPLELGITLDKALASEEAFKQRYEEDDEVKSLVDLARKLEGITRNVGRHAGGVVIAPSKLTDFAPLYYEQGQQITQFDKNDIEDIGIVKFDFLGLRTLTIIDWTVKAINDKRLANNQPIIDILNIPLDDRKTFQLLQSGDTTGVFQLESRGMKDLIARLQPDRFEDIIALVALFRPGPLQSGMVDDFIDRKLGRAEIRYPHTALAQILQSTYGVILYQEQVMQIAQVLAGYTLGAADLLRRAMGKKKPEEMAKQRNTFITGACDKGLDEKLANYIFDLMEKFAGYGFNKSHSAAYALVSYQTAWLKTHFPAEFMAAVLSSDLANTDKIVSFIAGCKQVNLDVIPPDINSSSYKFLASGKNKILYGLGAIKGIGGAAVDNILNARENGKFTDLFDFCYRVDLRKVTKKALEALIKSGAFDCFGLHQAALIFYLEKAVKAAEQMHKNQQSGQVDLFGIDAEQIGFVCDNNACKPWADTEQLAAEKSALGFYLTGHPIVEFTDELAKMGITNLASLKIGEIQKMAGWVVATRSIQTKRGDRMAFVTIEDHTNRQDFVVFADLYKASKELLKKDNLLIVEGEVSRDDYTGGLRVRSIKIMDLDTARAQFASNIMITLPVDYPADSKFANLLKSVITLYPGQCPIAMEYSKENVRAKITFPEKWQVTPSSELLTKLNNLATGIVANVCYN